MYYTLQNHKYEIHATLFHGTWFLCFFFKYRHNSAQGLLEKSKLDKHAYEKGHQTC
jgi:hypothetical protein